MGIGSSWFSENGSPNRSIHAIDRPRFGLVGFFDEGFIFKGKLAIGELRIGDNNELLYELLVINGQHDLVGPWRDGGAPASPEPPTAAAEPATSTSTLPAGSSLRCGPTQVPSDAMQTSVTGCLQFPNRLTRRIGDLQ